MTSWNWPNFSLEEITCPCGCGEVYVDPDSLDKLQDLRNRLNEPIYLNSAHRCGIHNARVGGAPLSMHRQLAFDIALKGFNRAKLLRVAKEVGFNGIGYGRTFLHVDNRLKPASWFYPGSKKMWEEIVP